MSAVLAEPAVGVLSVRGAVKRFGGVTALDGIDLDVHGGEVLALLGDNGAGKTTLIKCVSGALRLDSGSISMDGVEVAIHSPRDAQALGIETVYQDLALFDNLSPIDNFYAGRELAGPGWVPRSAAFASKVVILDEPTAALGVRESRKVLDLIRRLREQGTAVVVVSHAMDHVMEVADRAVVMRRGRKVGEVVPSAETYHEIVSLIVGGAD